VANEHDKKLLLKLHNNYGEMDELNSWISVDKQVNILLDRNCVAVTSACGITN